MDAHEEKLPWFQFYPADFQREAEHLSLAAVGGWMKILCRMHFAAARGEWRGTVLQLARCLNSSPEQAQHVLDEIRDPNNPSGRPVADFEALSGGTFLLRSRRMVRDEHRRVVNRENGKRGGNPKLMRSDNPPVNRPLNPRVKAISQSQSQRTGEVSPDPSSRPAASQPSADDGTNIFGVDVSENADGQRHDTAPPPDRDTRSAGSATRAEGSTPKLRRPRSETASPHHQAFIDWWCRKAYPSRMGGVEYEFGAEATRNGAAVKKLLRAVNDDLERAKAIAMAYLTADDSFIARRGRPLFGLTDQLTTWVQIAKGVQVIQQVRNNGQRNAASAGPAQQSRRPAPTLNGGPPAGPGPHAKAG
jgi:hypothetical protein